MLQSGVEHLFDPAQFRSPGFAHIVKSGIHVTAKIGLEGGVSHLIQV